MSNVTSRTLRYYDAIGLLTPAGTAANGYRVYERPQLLRLQEILVLRALGLPLEEIAGVLGNNRDQIETLRRHHSALTAESERLTALARTVDLTIDDLMKGSEMPAEQLFEGFDPVLQAEYEKEIAARYGAETVAESTRRTGDWSPEQFTEVAAAYQDIDSRLVELLVLGAGPGDERVTAVIADHFALVSRFWIPDRASYTGLGQMYVDDRRFRAQYDDRHLALAVYLRDAMTAYAEERLS